MDAGPPDNAVAWLKAVVAFLPVVVGGVSVYFRLFMESQAAIRKRVMLKRVTIVEGVAKRHSMLLQHVRSIERDDILRGDGREEPDLIGDLTSETFRAFTVIQRLETLRHLVRMAYAVLLVTMVLGIAGSIGSMIWTETQKYVIIASILLVSVQVLTVVLIWIASNILESYEDVA